MKSYTFETVCILAFFCFSGVTEADCVRGAVSCTNDTTAMQRVCSASLVCENAPSSGLWWAQSSIASNVQSCTPTNQNIRAVPSAGTVTFTLVARANTTSPTTRACGWHWFTSTGIADGSTSINTIDGLPVELMEFSVSE